jgi:hypothetical protein
MRCICVSSGQAGPGQEKDESNGQLVFVIKSIFTRRYDLFKRLLNGSADSAGRSRADEDDRSLRSIEGGCGKEISSGKRGRSGEADDRTSKMPVRFETIDQAREKATPTV